MNNDRVFYKILKEDLIHKGYQYKLGLNIDTKEFNKEPRCRDGLFFSDKDNIIDFMNYGSKIAKVYVPDNYDIIEVYNKYKAHAIELLEIHDIPTKEGIEWMNEEGIKITRTGWTNLSMCQTLSEDFIREFQDKVDWFWISECQTLSESFIREFKDRVNWGWISLKQKISEDFIKEFRDRVDWFWISKHQTLSDSFIREFQDKVDWYWISSNHQTLSEDFIKEFHDKLVD